MNRKSPPAITPEGFGDGTGIKVCRVLPDAGGRREPLSKYIIYLLFL